MKKICICLLMFTFFSTIGLNAQNRNDDIQFSLLTCEPGTEIYSLFGHTAIRYQNLTNGEDLVYNYGMFSFNTPNFIFRFIKGETDYQLGVVPYYYFEEEYSSRNSAVYYQTLNLTSDEKTKLKNILDDNYLPYNRTYRYNYFYDNCTTRARDKIEESIDGKVNYTKKEEKNSFRSIVHEFTKDSKWDELGIDLCLGQEADENINLRKQMFSPFYLFDSFKTANIVTKGTTRPLVSNSGILIQSDKTVLPAKQFISPIYCSILFFLLVSFYVLLVIKKKIKIWPLDVILFGAQGIAGCIITFLFFFSVHPTVGSNWMIFLFNPIPLIYLPFMVYKDIKKQKDIYHYVNIAYLTLFMVIMLVVRQYFNITILPLALSLMICSIGHIYLYRKNNK